MNKNIIFLMGLIRGLRKFAESETNTLMNLNQIKVYRTVSTRINEQDMNSGYVSMALIVDKTFQYSFPYIITGISPDDVTNKINALYSEAVASTGIPSAPNISLCVGADLNAKVNSQVAELCGKNLDSLFNTTVDVDKLLASIVYNSFATVINEIQARGLNAHNLFLTNYSVGNLTCNHGRFYFDYGLIVYVSGIVGGGLTLEVTCSHALQRAAKYDYLM